LLPDNLILSLIDTHVNGSKTNNVTNINIFKFLYEMYCLFSRCFFMVLKFQFNIQLVKIYIFSLHLENMWVYTMKNYSLTNITFLGWMWHAKPEVTLPCHKKVKLFLRDLLPLTQSWGSAYFYSNTFRWLHHWVLLGGQNLYQIWIISQVVLLIYTPPNFKSLRSVIYNI